MLHELCEYQLPEFMMRNHVEKLPVSQKIHFQIGDTPKHTISFYRSISYTIILIKFPDTTDQIYPEDKKVKVLRMWTHYE